MRTSIADPVLAERDRLAAEVRDGAGRVVATYEEGRG